MVFSRESIRMENTGSQSRIRTTFRAPERLHDNGGILEDDALVCREISEKFWQNNPEFISGSQSYDGSQDGFSSFL